MGMNSVAKFENWVQKFVREMIIFANFYNNIDIFSFRWYLIYRGWMHSISDKL